MKTLNIEYFAILREQAGMSGEQRSSAAATAAELFEELREAYGFGDSGNFKVAINEEFAAWDDTLNDGDRVVFIPPVAGG